LSGEQRFKKENFMKLHILILALSATALFNVACSSVSTKSDYTDTPEYQNRPALKQDLMQSKGEHLSSNELNSLLTQKVNYSKPLKIAIVKLGHKVDQKSFAGNYSRNYRQYATDSNSKAFRDLIKNSRHIKDVSFVPSMLMPADTGLQSLRDVAARMQADLLLVLQTGTDSDYALELFGKNEAKATATIEAVAVDVRTGTIPFTSVATGTEQRKIDKQDFSNQEFRDHVIIAAEDKAIEELAHDVGEYFK